MKCNKTYMLIIALTAFLAAYALFTLNAKKSCYIPKKDQSRIAVQTNVRLQSLFDDYLGNTVVYKR